MARPPQLGTHHVLAAGTPYLVLCQLSEASHESAETIKHVEHALQLVAPPTLAKLEACLDAELARQKLTGKKP